MSILSEELAPGFELLYTPSLNENVASIANYVDKFAKGLGLKSLGIDPNRLYSVAGSLVRPDFPHVDGIEKASPFKKAANFFVWFVAERPIVDEIPSAIIGADLSGIPNHQNVIFAYHMAVDCLENAQIFRKDSVITLSERISVSRHFFCDFVEAYSAAVPMHDFKKLSLCFEQLAYCANPCASYDRVI